MRALISALVLSAVPALGLAAEFTCHALPIIGGISEAVTVSDKKPRVSFEDTDVACAMIVSKSAVYCVKGPLARSKSFQESSDEKLLSSVTDLDNEWVGGDLQGSGFMAKFIEGSGDSATGLLLNCVRK